MNTTQTSRFLTPEDHAALTPPAEVVRLFRSSYLADRTPRTLVYGYTVDRDTFHLYLDEEGSLVRHRYRPEYGPNFDTDPTDRRILTVILNRSKSMRVDWLYPNKRVYPERCDLEFCTIMRERFGINAPFTNYDPDRIPAPGVMFHGLRPEGEQR